MKLDGKLNYIELQAAGGTIDGMKSFYSAAFGWTFTDYGPSYSSFAEGLDGGFDGAAKPEAKPLPIIYAVDLEAAFNAVTEAGGRIVQPIYAFPGGRRFHFADPAGNELAVWSE